MSSPITPAFSPAAERNREPIAAVLRARLPAQGCALEVSSGTGQHVAWFAAALPGWHWWPSDWQDSGFASITAWVARAGVANVAPPRVLDVTADRWFPDLDPQQLPQFDLIYNANMLHIAPWACCAGLMAGAARHLAPGGRLVTYGPYLEDDVPTGDGNRAFDERLRAENPAWGLRRREDVAAEAARAGLVLTARHPMPANNLLLVWQRATNQS